MNAILAPDTAAPDTAATGTIIPAEEHEVEVCHTCLLVIANGDSSGDETWDGDTFAANMEGYRAVPGPIDGGDGDAGFSHRDCELCDGLAGNRFTVTLVEL